MKNVVSENYKLTPNEIEKRSPESESLKTEFNFEHIEVSKKVSDRLNRYDKKIYSKKEKTKRKVR